MSPFTRHEKTFAGLLTLVYGRLFLATAGLFKPVSQFIVSLPQSCLRFVLHLAKI